MKRLVFAIFTICLLGCTRVSDLVEKEKPEEKQEHRVVCTNEGGNIIEFKAENDDVTEITETFFQSYEELGVTEQMVPEEINEKISSQLAQKYEPIGGVSFEVVSEEDRAKIVMTIDCKKANVEKLVEFGILSEGEEGSGAISLETLKNGLEQDEAYGCEIQ